MRRPLALGLVVLVALGALVAGGIGRAVAEDLPAAASGPAGRTKGSNVDARAAGRSVTYPTVGPGRWRFAAGAGSVAGRSGRLLRFRVAVEQGISGVAPDGFAAAVGDTLADPRGWTAGGRWRFQRVGRGAPADFTVYLATPGTRDRLCAMGYDRYTSCRNGDRVVVNVARWVHAVPHYRAALDTYRRYVVNHEVGHRLGHKHERCPRRGRPAPVMQQQTLGLHGCTAYAWPFRAGRRYTGPPGVHRS